MPKPEKKIMCDDPIDIKTNKQVDIDELLDYTILCNKCHNKRTKKDYKEKKNGGIMKTCKLCIEKQTCQHNRVKTRCKECKGGSICEHNIIRASCKECDPEGHLSNVVRSRINQQLKGNKEGNTNEYLGCTTEEYKKHLESKFVENMKWENYGKLWNIDHIIPLQYNKPTLLEVIERLHWTNTQPLLIDENFSKKNKNISESDLEVLGENEKDCEKQWQNDWKKKDLKQLSKKTQKVVLTK
jgi:hypothetical protein